MVRGKETLRIDGDGNVGVVGNNNSVTLTVGAPSRKVLVDLPRRELLERRENAVRMWKRYGRRQYVCWQYAIYVLSLLFLFAATINVFLHELIARGAPVELMRRLASISVIQWIWNIFAGLGAPLVMFLCAFVAVVIAAYLDRLGKKYCREQRGHLIKQVEDIDAALRQCIE